MSCLYSQYRPLCSPGDFRSPLGPLSKRNASETTDGKRTRMKETFDGQPTPPDPTHSRALCVEDVYWNDVDV